MLLGRLFHMPPHAPGCLRIQFATDPAPFPSRAILQGFNLINSVQTVCTPECRSFDSAPKKWLTQRVIRTKIMV